MSDTQVRAYLRLLPDLERKAVDNELLRAMAADTVRVLAETRKFRRK